MNEETLTRQEILAIWRNPTSTQEQRIQAKLILCKRISSAPERVRQFIDTLPLEIAEKMRVNHPMTYSIEWAMKADEEERRLKALLAQIQSPNLETETPAV